METELHSVQMNKNTYLSIGIVVLIIAATIWLNDGQHASLQAAIDLKVEVAHVKEIRHLQDDIINSKVDSLTSLIKSYGEDRYSGHDHDIFAARLQELNPALKVPRTQK